VASDFLEAVARFIDQHELLAEGARVLVGVSGGPDSMVCLATLRALGYDVHALHVNYGLRAGAEDDEALVREWCDGQAPPIPLRVLHLDAEGRAERRDESLQEAARGLRYEAFAGHASKIGAAAAAVGHHRDDQAETLLLNLLRGSGPEGLAGMPPSRPLRGAAGRPLIRPLLGRSRAEVEAHASEAGIPWNEDPSNRDPAYDRAVVRTEVVPLLQKHFANPSETLARTAGLLREYVDHTLRPSLDTRLTRCYVDREKGGLLALGPLREEPSVWRRRLILAALEQTLPEAPQTAAFATEVAALIEAQVGRRVDVAGGTIWRERDGLRLLPAEAAPEEVWPPIPVPWGEDVPLPGGVLRIDLLDDRPDTLDAGTPCVEYVDADRLVDPLDVRTWRDGDRLQPLGLDGTKLVSDLLTEAKVPSHRRPGTYILSTDEHVAWVIGHRLDRRVRVRPSTEQVARLSWKPSEAWRPREKTSDDCNSR
jgi:tRNA(Ile)-lysidine synthase